jgi:hypothetical protein
MPETWGQRTKRLDRARRKRLPGESGRRRLMWITVAVIAAVVLLLWFHGA